MVDRRTRRPFSRLLSVLVSTALVGTLLAVVTPPQLAHAAGTVLFQNAFTTNTVTGGTGTVTLPTPATGTNAACLTATGGTSGVLRSCTGASDTAGNGALRLTAATGSQIGGIFGATSFPTSSGLDVTFDTYQYGGNGADGMSFVLAAVDPTNPAPPTVMAPGGGSLGYSTSGGTRGLANAYLGVGLDVFGNFSSPSIAQGSGCASTPNITAAVPGAVVVRGPGNGTVGYCGLSTSWTGATTSRVTLRASTRAGAVVPVQVLINPSATTLTANNGTTVAPGTYKVVFTPVGGAQRTLTGTLPTVPTTLYSSSTYLNANGIPKQLSFGFAGSTGGSTDVHEARNMRVATMEAVAELAVSSTSYAAATSSPGDPVNYVVTPSVQAGVGVTRPISMTQTVPAGVRPVGAFGTGWTCQPPSGQTVTCTTTASSFAAGATLPNVTVVGIATATVSASTVQTASTSAVSSENANPASDTTMTPGTLPTAPSGITVSPNNGPTAGGGSVTISGSNLTGATAVEIGTTSEQQAGTPVVLLPCSATVTTSCFTVSGANLVVASWPARASTASVEVTVVTLGVDGSATYDYAARPSAPAAPTATAGVTRATVSWTAPASNGSPLTGYVVTPYLNGVAQTAVSYDAGATSRTLTGLTAGGSYTFTVSAVNAYGTSTASPASAAVTPYTVPGPPAITAATAGDSAATLTWNAPNSTGFSPITGYVVTPYRGGVAEAPVTFSGTATTRTVTGLTPGASYTFTVAAQNAAGTGAPSATSSTVVPNASPSLTFPAPPPGEVGAAYSRQLVVNDGTAPFTWSVASGALPAGITLNATSGLLSGTPTAAGTFTFVVQVTDASGESATRSVTLVIAAAPSIAFAPAAGEVSVPYSQTPAVNGGTAPFTWAVTAGSLPAGITLNPSSGALTGTPTAAGTYSLTLQVTDAFNQTANRTVSIVIAPLPTLGIANTTTPQVGVAYSNSLPVSGGTAPFTWSITAGSLPAGLSLDAGTGALTGTPTTAGSFSATVTVVDGFGKTASRVFAGTVAAGPLVITKTASSSSAVPGARVGYTITVANTGSQAISGVSLTDPLTGVLDDAGYNGDLAASAGTPGYASSTVSWTGAVAAGATVTLTYSVTVANPGTGNQVLSNTVSSPTPGTNCAGTPTDPRCTATVTVSGLSITKTAGSATTTPGSTVRFTVVARNTGQTAYVGATFTDDLTGVLDDATYDADATTTAGALSYTGGRLTWTGNLAVGATVTVTYTVRVADPDPGDRSLVGVVVSPTAASTCPSGNTAASCRAAVTVLVPALAVSVTSSASSVTPGDRVPFTWTLANTGQTSYPGAVATLDLTGALDDATYGQDAVASAGTLSYQAGTLTWTGDLAQAQVVTVTLTTTVRNPDPGDRRVTAVAASSAAGSTCPTGSTASACTSTVAVLVPALTVSTATDVTATTPGSTVRYTVTVANTGQTAYAGAVVDDDLAGVLDDATFNNDLRATTGTASLSGSTVSWTGDLAVGASATVTFSVTVRSPDPGDLELVSTLTSPTRFSSCPPTGGGPACRSSVAVLLPGLALGVEADPATTIPGGTVQYTVTARNTGQTAYAGTTVTWDLAGVLDDAGYGADAVASTGDLALADGRVSWTLDLPVGGTATVRGTVTVRAAGALADRQLSTRVSSTAAGSTCLPSASAPPCTSVVPVLLPGLLVTKTADTSTVLPGGVVGYTITLANTGQTTQTDARVDDELAQVLTDAVLTGPATATTGTLTLAGSVLSWTGTLAPGASATISYSVTVRDPDPGDKRLVNTVTTSAPGSNCPVGSTDARCTSVVDVTVPALRLVQRADRETTLRDGVVTFTVDVTNAGATAYPAATVETALDGLLDDAVLTGTPTASTGQVGVTGSVLRWSGSLAVGASARITYAATVNREDVGDDLVTTTVTSTSRGATCVATGTARAPADARCSVTVPVARLVIERTARESTATPGSTIHIPATYSNTGQVPFVGITVVHPRGDSADDVYPTGDDTATSGSLTRTDDAIRWTGDIPVGGSVTVNITRTVRDPDPGNHIATATIYSDVPGNNCLPGSSDPRCTYRVLIVEPGLTLTKTANTSTVVPGGTVAYTLTIANTGETPYTGATATDDLAGILDDATYNADATADRGTVSSTGSTLSWTGDLAVGQRATVTYTATVRTPATGDKSMVNPIASSERGSTCPPAAGTAACRAVVAVLTPALTITKAADVRTANLGTAVGYTITVLNSGQTAYASASFTDPLDQVLDDATYSRAATATRGAVSYASGVLSWSGALAVGESATISYGVTTRTAGLGDRSLVNTVSSPTTGSNCAAGSTDARCTETVAVTNATDLTFAKSADAEYTTRGSTVTYTVRVTNSSPSGVPVTFTDALAGVLDDATYNGDARASTGTVAVSGSTLSWSAGSLPPGTATVTYSVTVNGTRTGDQVLSGVLTSGAGISSSNCATGSTDPRCTTSTPIAALEISQAYTEASTTPGSVVHLTATFTNTGAYDYTGITIASPSADTVDDAIPNGDQRATSGTLVLTAGAITWTGNLPAGGTPVTITGTLTVKNPVPAEANRLITGTLATTAPGTTCPPSGTDARCTATLPVLLPGLTLSKTADVASVTPGDTVRYTVTITNTGETPYTGATATDDLTGVLDDARYNADATATRGTLSYTGSALRWSGDLAVGASVTVGYSVTVLTPPTGDKVVANFLTSSDVGSTCPPGNSRAACQVTLTVLTPALTLDLSTDRETAVAGDRVTYTALVTNSGQTSYPAASFRAPLAGVLDDASVGSVTATRGTATRSGDDLVWSGALAPGASATVTWTVTVGTPADYALTTSLISTDRGSNCPVDPTDPRCSSEVLLAGLRLVNRVDVSTTQPTGVVNHTGTFTNVGRVPLQGITVTDSFRDTLDDAVYNGDAAATTGSLIVVVGSGQIVWTGDLAPGATATITGSVTVRNPPPTAPDGGYGVLRTSLSTATPGSNCPAGAPGPDCSTVVDILRPALTLGLSADTSTATPGDPIGYTLTVTNSGETSYPAASAAVALDSAVDDAPTLSALAATLGAATASPTEVTWTGALGPRETAVITFRLTVDNPDRGDKTVLTTASSTSLGASCPPGAAGAACTSTVTVLVPALDVAINADRTTTTPGSRVGWTVTVTNSGETAYAGAVVATDLAAVLDDTSAPTEVAASTGTVTLTGTTLTWTGSLAVGASATITYAVLVTDPPTGDRVLTSAVSSAAPGSSCPAAAPCAATVRVLLPGLSVDLRTDRTTATPGEDVRHTVTVTNTGQTPYPGAVVRLATADLLDDAVLDGAPVAGRGTVRVEPDALVWTADLGVGESSTLSLVLTVRDPVPTVANRRLVTTVVTDVAGSPCRTGGTNPACTSTVAVLVPHLTVTTAADKATTVPGGVITFTTVVRNDGETPYLGARVTDDLTGVLTDARYNGDATVTGGGVLDYSAPVLGWTGDLPVGAAATISYTVTVNNPTTGDRQVRNAVSSPARGSTCPPGGAGAGCSATVQVLVPALGVTKTASTTSVVAGSRVQYTITLTNTGETAHAPATFRDDLVGVLDDATYPGDATATSGTLGYANGVLTWSGPLGLGASATISYSVTTTYPAAGDRVLRNTVVSDTAGSTCPPGGTRARCRSTVAVLVPALSITKTVDTDRAVAGSLVRYRVQATNTGEAPYSTATLVDDLSGVVDDAAAPTDVAASTGSVTRSGDTLTWSGPLAQGASVVVTYSVRVTDQPRDSSLVNTVTSTTVGSSCPPPGDAASCRTTTTVDPTTLTVRGLTPSFVLTGLPGDQVRLDDAVQLTVTTNSSSGYTVGVQAQQDQLLPATGPGGDSIPIDRLQVRTGSDGAFESLRTDRAITVHQQDRPSAPGGDAVSDDYQVQIPFVASDTYSTELEYIVSAQ